MGKLPTACQGGVTLYIDTSKAFDTVDRRILEQELRAARVPEPELAIIYTSIEILVIGLLAKTRPLESPVKGACVKAVPWRLACGP